MHRAGLPRVLVLWTAVTSSAETQVMNRSSHHMRPESFDEAITRTSRMIPGMLLDMQNRGQLAAGFTTYKPGRPQLMLTHKDVGGVAEVFRMNQEERYKSLMGEYAGHAAIGHVRYATCGTDHPSYAQPFERQHIARSKWFSFAFNGQLANYRDLCRDILQNNDFHLTRETDTEVLHHLISHELSLNAAITPVELLNKLSKILDGSWNIVFLNARGQMFVSRDPLGMRPLCYAHEGSLFAAASESVGAHAPGLFSGKRSQCSAGTCRHRRRRLSHGAEIRRQPEKSTLLL